MHSYYVCTYGGIFTSWELKTSQNNASNSSGDGGMDTFS